MNENLTKLRPDRDLQCYFQEPSTVAALSSTSPNGFTVSGSFRQQFDWAVLEWNRDNVFEHPALRNLPDGDLSGITLSYEESRDNCIPIDSTAYDPLGWSYLRVWEQHDEAGADVEQIHWVPLLTHATPVHGSYVPAIAVMELQGTPTVGDLIELMWLDDHCNYEIAPGDTLETALSGLAQFINGKQSSGSVVTASSSGARITLTYNGAPGANGNRVGVYGSVYGAGTESWSPGWAIFSGGTSPDRWRVTLDFGHLQDKDLATIDMTNVRKLRWTWAPDLQLKQFARNEFSVVVTNWEVAGTNLAYSVAGPGSRRIEDTSSGVTFSGTWLRDTGNYSGGSIRYTETPGDFVECSYVAQGGHSLYLGTRYLDFTGGEIKATIQVDGGSETSLDLKKGGEDVLARHRLGQYAGGVPHTVKITHAGAAGSAVYFDFLELAIPTTALPSFGIYPTTTLATDWDTDHSLAIAPERTAWLINSLGFKGRANHYAGAMWFYELNSFGVTYGSGTVEFSGTPRFMDTVTVTIGGSAITHVCLTSDTPETLAKCFELLIGAELSAVWAQAEGSILTITSRTMGPPGNSITLQTGSSNSNLHATASSETLMGGNEPTADLDAAWRTDLQATPRLNRAARDWSRSFFQALKGYGIDVAAAFSTELRHGDDSSATGIAQRYPGGPVWVNTPALQTNFSPASLDFWQRIYCDMADVMADAGVRPYLQFGEVQWWYKPDDKTGMPFYDDYTKSQFQAAYGRSIGFIPDQHADPASFPEECEFLPNLIGQFTSSIMTFVTQIHADARFEVLYPLDVNDTPLNRLINYPSACWTPASLSCLKTENFLYTGNRDLNKARESIQLPMALTFPAQQASHLVGIGDPTTPWNKERRLAIGAGLESVVLFALDQFCLVGYSLPLPEGLRQGRFMGK